jgi:hypothetical protein
MTTEGYVAPDRGSREIPRGRAKNRPNGERSLTRAEKAIRDAAIVSAHASGQPPPEIAREYGITRRAVHQIVAAFDLRPTLLDAAPIAIIERRLREYEQLLHIWVKVAEDTLERAPACAIAAWKGYSDTLEKHTLLLASIGKLPDNLELLRGESELNQVAERMERVLLEVCQGERTPEEAFEEFSRLMTPAPAYELASSEVSEE